MNLAEFLRQNTTQNWARRIIKTPASYRLASWFFQYNRGQNNQSTREMTAMAMDQTARALIRKEPVAWTTAFFPSEILHALDIIPFAPEVAAGAAAAVDIAPIFLQEAAAEEVPEESCSFHRCAVGGSRVDLFPDPDILVASSHLCDGAPHLFRYLAREIGQPFWGLDVPSRSGEEAEKYLASQLRDITTRLEKLAGRKISSQKWRETLISANRTRENMLGVKRMRQRVPSLLRGEEALSFVYLQFLGYGHPRSEKISRLLYQELKDRWEKEKNKTSSVSQIRIIWLHLRPYYTTELFRLLEGELGGRIVFEEMNNIYWDPLDPDYPYRSLARKILSHPGVGPIERRLQGIGQMVEDFQADAVIHFSHWGCRQSMGALPYIRQRLREQDIPFLALDGDCIDRGSFPAGQIRTRVESFMEILSDAVI